MLVIMRVEYTVYGSIDKSEDDITDTLSDHLIFNSIISAGDSMGVYTNRNRDLRFTRDMRPRPSKYVEYL